MLLEWSMVVIYLFPPHHMLAWDTATERDFSHKMDFSYVCDFNLHFTYALTGWEGSASDVHVYRDVIASDLWIPAGKYLLADVGFPLCSKLLVPFHGVQYHLAEWAQSLKWYGCIL